jgi:threonine/homoserine/homoserine lactone efflux protein
VDAALLAFASVMLVHLLGAMSPGPAFVFVARTSVAISRRSGVFAALGLGVGAIFWALLTIMGWAILVREAAWLHSVLRIAGGLYLIWLGISLWRSGKQPLAEDGIAVPSGDLAAFWRGLATQLSNPKIMVFFGSVFIAVLPADPPSWFTPAMLAGILVNECLWYALVARVFSTNFSRRAYGRLKLHIDRIAGGLIAAVGLSLIASER